MKTLIPFLVAGALALTAAASFAQAPAGEHQKMTPEQRQQMKEHFKAAREACKDSQDKRACMSQQMCSKAPDPAKCQERAKEHRAGMSQHMDQRQAAHEACTGKRGDELMKCLEAQRKK